jgi:hypothetical protein
MNPYTRPLLHSKSNDSLSSGISGTDLERYAHLLDSPSNASLALEKPPPTEKDKYKQAM